MFPAERSDVTIVTFADRNVVVPTRQGMAGVDAILSSQPHGWTKLGEAVAWANEREFDRLIVITDEQSASAVPNPRAPKAYMINVASYKNGVGYRNGWTHIDGFSEKIFDYIREIESM
jgi:hypothetical protein